MKLSESSYRGVGLCGFCRSHCDRGRVVAPAPYDTPVFLCSNCAANPVRVGELLGSACADAGLSRVDVLQAFTRAFNEAQVQWEVVI